MLVGNLKGTTGFDGNVTSGSLAMAAASLGYPFYSKISWTAFLGSIRSSPVADWDFTGDFANLSDFLGTKIRLK